MGIDDVVQPSAPGAEALPPPRELPFEFRATGGEYFRIWIVNLLLSIVTLGIYSAWAKVRRLRYFYGSTSLDGHGFDYHGRPIAILKGRLIAFVIYIGIFVSSRFMPLLYLALLPVILFGVPWVIMRARRFQMRMTSWRGLRFNFRGTYRQALAAFIGWPIAGTITAGILMPLATHRQAKYSLDNSGYGNQPFRFMATGGAFYVLYILSGVIAFGAVLAAVFVIGTVVASLGLSSVGTMAGISNPQEAAEQMRQFFLRGGFLLPIIFALAFTLPAAYYRATFTNTAFDGLQIGPHRVRARLRTLPLAWIMVSNLVAVICTLGLFYPWARVRLVRYQLANITVIADGDLNQFTAGAADGTDAVGEEISDFFDLDFGF